MIVQLKGKTCLVTGASGFIGAFLCKELRKQGAIVKAIFSSEASGDWDSHVLCKLGVDPIPTLFLQGVDIVFHLAGYAHSISEGLADDELYFKTNVDGTRDLLLAAKNEGVSRFIYFSSVKAMGEETSKRLDETSRQVPLSAYGISKLEAENLVLHGEYVASPTVLRLPMVYGDSDKGNLPRMVKAISNNRFPPFPKVENKRSMIHVEDVVQGSILAATNSISIKKTYILVDGVDYSTRQLYELICMSIGKKIPLWSIPKFIFYALAKVGDMLNYFTDPRKYFGSSNFQKLFGNSFYSCEKAKAELGFYPTHTLDNSIASISSITKAK